MKWLKIMIIRNLWIFPLKSLQGLITKPLPEMVGYINNFYSDNFVDFDKIKKPHPEIIDPELNFIDELFDNQIINSLLAPEGYSAPHRYIQLFRMELLKILKYPEISYRKFCTYEYFGMERKQEICKASFKYKGYGSSYRIEPFQNRFAL